MFRANLDNAAWIMGVPLARQLRLVTIHPMNFRHSLAFRLAAAFLGFVIVGSLGVFAWLDYAETHESQSAFAAVA